MCALSKAKYASLAEAVNERMTVLNLGLHNISGRTGISYEHLRKIAKGEALPSPIKLEKICNVLGLDLHSMQSLELSERLRKKYGATGVIVPPRDAQLRKLQAAWPKLSKSQRRILLKLVEMFT